jgi:hypothetical protein
MVARRGEGAGGSAGGPWASCDNWHERRWRSTLRFARRHGLLDPRLPAPAKDLRRTTSETRAPGACVLQWVEDADQSDRPMFGRHRPIQRYQVNKSRNIVERLPKHLHASVRAAWRQASELDDAEKVKRPIRNLAFSWNRWRRKITAIVQFGLAFVAAPLAHLHQPHREHEGAPSGGSRNLKRWRDASMALRWTRLRCSQRLPVLEGMQAFAPRCRSKSARAERRARMQCADCLTCQLDSTRLAFFNSGRVISSQLGYPSRSCSLALPSARRLARYASRVRSL